MEVFLKELTNIFKALSDETRLRILKLLEGGELCVCDIMAALDKIQPKISFHLGVLKKANLLKGTKQGKWMHYKIDDSDLFKRLILMSVLERIPDGKLEGDKKRLDEFLKNKTTGSLPHTAQGACCSSNIKRRIKHED
jgi:ArsR family transcriptional regulator, arsenate/arsenite/antimonite-responsive transcriptional repressor